MHNTARAAAVAILAAALGVLALPGIPATASHTSAETVALDQLPQIRSENRQASAVVYPLRGEGMIAITTRVCGSSATWRAEAVRNGVTPPVYLVLLGQRLTIACTTGAAPASTPPTVAAPASWAHPTDIGDCITPNGNREFGAPRPGHRHGGIDFGAPARTYAGDAIHAVHAGTAHHGYDPGGAGTYVWIDHHDGTSSWYFHMASRAVANNAAVAAGQVIGHVGISGNATAYHLHLEIKVNGGRVDPVPFLAARGVTVGC